MYFRAVFWLVVTTGYDCSDSEGRIGDVKDGEGFSMTVPKGEKYSCVRARWITALLLVLFLVDIIDLVGLITGFCCVFFGMRRRGSGRFVMSCIVHVIK